MTWLVIHTKARAEEEAAAQLANQGYQVFLPKVRERKRRNNRWQWVTGPLFPRYLFVDVTLGEKDVAPIRSTVGVASIVRFGQTMAQVSGDVIAYLMSHQDEEIGAVQDKSTYKPGDVVEILEGPFEGVNAVYQLKKGEDRVLVLIELLGRKSEVVVDEHSVRGVK